jgi:hypothetical protein
VGVKRKCLERQFDTPDPDMLAPQSWGAKRFQGQPWPNSGKIPIVEPTLISNSFRQLATLREEP